MERFVLVLVCIYVGLVWFWESDDGTCGFGLCRYKILEELGDGTCGSVYKAVNLETYEVVSCWKFLSFTCLMLLLILSYLMFASGCC